MTEASRPPTPTPVRRSPPLWKKGLGLSGGIFLGAVLLVAAWAKLLDPIAFAEQIRLEGLDFLLPAAAVAFLALALEVGLGSALLLGVRRLWVLVATSGLVVFFLWLTGRNYWLTSQGLREEGESCGCFGNLVERTPAEAFTQDLLLLVPPLILAFLAWQWGSTRWLRPRLAVVAGLTLLALVVAWKAPELPLDNLATRLKPGVDVAELCVGAEADRICLNVVVPEFSEGRHLVVLADLGDPAFEQAVGSLNDYVAKGGEPPLWILSAATLDEQQAFFWQFGPRFEIREVPEALLRPLYRRLPRSFILDQGEVTVTYSGLPPLDQISAEPALATFSVP